MKVYLNRTSNAPLRVRIAIALKHLAVEEVNVIIDGGQQHAEEFKVLNPQKMVPVLVDGDNIVRQSLAIIEYLNDKQPLPPLLPADSFGRARVRALALAVACDGQPLLNLRVRQYLQSVVQLTATQRRDWMKRWMLLSLAEYEALVNDGRNGVFSHGDTPTLADVCLVPQVLMAERFKIGTSGFPALMRIFAAMMALHEVRAAVARSASQTG
jgi:maleylacetoacetate isomerase/maleylpyruvate isomerase